MHKYKFKAKLSMWSHYRVSQADDELGFQGSSHRPRLIQQ